VINPLNERITLNIQIRGDDPEDCWRASREIDAALQVAGFRPRGSLTASGAKPQLRVIPGGASSDRP
jgi:hypothetical protein